MESITGNIKYKFSELKSEYIFFIVIMQRFLLYFPIFVCNIGNKNVNFIVYFHVLMFAPCNFLEIKLLSVVYYCQSRINILMYISSEKKIKVFNLKQKQALRGKITFSVSIICRLAEYFIPIRYSTTSSTVQGKVKACTR